MGVLPKPTAHGPALVLRVWPCRETSVIASLLTRDHGFVKVLARGVRQPGSRLRPLVEPGRLIEAEFSLDAERDLQFLRGGNIELDPMSGEPTLEKSAFLQGALELIDRCGPLDEGDERTGTADLFAVCEQFVRVLSSASCRGPALLFFAFEWELLARHGMAPEIESCISCGTPLAELSGATLWFSPGEGGVLCEDCSRQGSAGKRPLGAPALGYLRNLSRLGLAQDLEHPLPRAMRREIGAALHHFLGYHLPAYRLPRALELLRQPRAVPVTAPVPDNQGNLKET